MANWETKTVKDVVTAIHYGKIILPVIQRRFVWNDDKMELLFNKDIEPLFEFRKFSDDGSPRNFEKVNLLQYEQSFVI